MGFEKKFGGFVLVPGVKIGVPEGFVRFVIVAAESAKSTPIIQLKVPVLIFHGVPAPALGNGPLGGGAPDNGGSGWG